MEPQNEFHVEDKNNVCDKLVVEEHTLNITDTVKQSFSNHENVLEANEVAESAVELLDSKGSKAKSGGAKLSTASKDSAPKSGGNRTTKRVVKEPANVKGAASYLRNQKPLSQSLCFPSKRAQESLLKSIDASAMESNSKQPLLQSKRLDNNPCDGHTSSEVLSKATNAKKNSTVSAPSTKSSVSAKSDMKKTSVNGLTFDASPNHGNSATRKSLSTSGFAFRLEGRSEKRKEFNMKMEEKINAIEAEKNNLYSKTKESQEVEIKRLRKNLKFKATPMPSFYKEPPLKAEIKKKPTTRARSPKLGRHKNSVSSTDNNSEKSASNLIPRLSTFQKRIQANSAISSDIKKAVKKSQFKLMREEKTAKSNAKKEEVEAENTKEQQETQSIPQISI